jgi:hypothetical protein
MILTLVTRSKTLINWSHALERNAGDGRVSRMVWMASLGNSIWQL